MKVWRNATYTVAGEADLTAIDLAGEVLWQVQLRSGAYTGAGLLGMLPADALGEVDGEVTEIRRGFRVAVADFGPGQFASAANPSFKPQPGLMHQIEMVRRLRRLEGLERREAVQRVHRARANAAADEPEPDAEPKKLAKPVEGEAKGSDPA